MSNLTVTKLFIIYLVFITQSYFSVPKYIRPNSTQFYYENSKQIRASTNRI